MNRAEFVTSMFESLDKNLVRAEEESKSFGERPVSESRWRAYWLAMIWAMGDVLEEAGVLKLE